MYQQISIAYVAKGRAMLKKTCIVSVCLLSSKMDGGSEVEKKYSLQCLYFFFCNNIFLNLVIALAIYSFIFSRCLSLASVAIIDGIF